jgi:hypothetical protein
MASILSAALNAVARASRMRAPIRCEWQAPVGVQCACCRALWATARDAGSVVAAVAAFACGAHLARAAPAAEAKWPAGKGRRRAIQRQKHARRRRQRRDVGLVLGQRPLRDRLIAARDVAGGVSEQEPAIQHLAGPRQSVGIVQAWDAASAVDSTAPSRPESPPKGQTDDRTMASPHGCSGSYGKMRAERDL